MTIRLRWKRVASHFAISAFLVLVIGWLALIASQWQFRRRAEMLLADVKSLELSRSSNVDVQKLMTRWGTSSDTYTDCSEGDCRYSILISHLSPYYPPFVLEEGPHLVTRALEFAGLRGSEVKASFSVEHGTLVSKEFDIDVPLPLSQWLGPKGHFWLKSEIGSVYWPSLDVASVESSRMRYSTPSQNDEHLNRGFVQARIRLVANFTPAESVQEQSALMDFRFDCITRWRACSSRGELLPQAEKEFSDDIAAARQ